MEKITVDDAVELFKFPKALGKHGKRNVSLFKGQFGYYLKYGDDKIGLKITDEEADDYTLEDAVVRIEENDKKFLWKKSYQDNLTAVDTPLFPNDKAENCSIYSS